MAGSRRTWLSASIVLLLLTAAVHALSFLAEPMPSNDTEKQLMDLMATYKLDLGAGFTPTMEEISTALSACFSLLYLLGGLVLWLLLRGKAPDHLLLHVVMAYVAVFGIAFGIMATFTFLPPIVLTGLVFVCLIGSWAGLRRSAA